MNNENSKYILYDEEGTILGLEMLDTPKIEDGWVTISNDAFEYVLSHNGTCFIDVEQANPRAKMFRLEGDANYNVVTSDLILPISMKEIDIDYIKQTIIQSNSSTCNKYIENGIDYLLDGNNRKYTYKIEDQINFEQLFKLISDDILNDETKIPLKGSEEDAYDYISISKFIDIYYELLKNKYYHLFYLKEYNNYILTIDSLEILDKVNYGMELPEKYMNTIKDQLSKFDALKEVR